MRAFKGRCPTNPLVNFQADGICSPTMTVLISGIGIAGPTLAYWLSVCLGVAPSSRRLRAGTSLSKFATLVAVCKDRDTKAELNRRGQICEVLIDTGISHRGRCWSADLRIGGLVIWRNQIEPNRSSAFRKWTGMRVARRLFRFGLPSEALSLNQTSPPSHKAMKGILHSESTNVGSERRMEDRRVSLTPRPGEMACQP